MKSRIVKGISFILILLILLVILSYITIPKNNLKEFGMEEIKANGILGEKYNSIDILIVGDSESYTSIVPMALWEDYGFTSYVSGVGKQNLVESLSYVNQAMKTQKPKIVILESHNIYTKVSLSEPASLILKKLLPVFKYHNRWKDLNNNDFGGKIDYTWIDDLKGYKYSEKVKPADDSNYMSYTDKAKSIPKVNQILVKLLKEYCNMNNAQLLVLSTPSTINWDYESHNGAKKFLDEENIEFLDLNVLKDEVKIDWQQDTRDAGDHLNYKGALKVTKYVGEYLKNKNILEDHREAKEYNKWSEALKRYKEMIEKSKK